MAETDPIDSSTTSTLPTTSALSAHTIPAFLAPTPTSYFLRAWERRPRPALSRSFRTRTVWKKRWDLDRAVSATSLLTASVAKSFVPTSPTISSIEAGSKSPAASRRVVKRRCIVLEDACSTEETGSVRLAEDSGKALAFSVNRTGRGTSWERRDSGRFRKRHIIGEKQLLKIEGNKPRSPSSTRSPLKIANSLSHQGLSFSSPVRQLQTEELSPTKRRRSSSVDMLFDGGNETASAVFMPVSEDEGMYLSDTISDNVAFWEGNNITDTNKDRANGIDYELHRAHKTSSSIKDMVPVNDSSVDDAISISSLNSDERQALQYKQASCEAVIGAESDIIKAVTDETITASSDAKPELDTHLVLDTALLRDFLDRAAASKERKRDDIAKQSSILHRRDSDAVRNALGSGSPMKALGERDAIPPPQLARSRSRSPDKKINSSAEKQNVFDDVAPAEPSFSEVNVTVKMEASSSPTKTSRRSNRVRNSRAPQPNPEAAVDAGDEHSKNDHQVSQRAKSKDKTSTKKTEAQELAQLTRRNSIKNKRGSLPVSLRLVDLAKNEEQISREQPKDEIQREASKDAQTKTVTWAENLVQYSTSNDQVCIILKKSSYSTPRKPQNSALPNLSTSSLLVPTSKLRSAKLENIQSSVIGNGQESQTPSTAATSARKPGPNTPRARRVRGLGTSNGTPAKGFFAASLLPSEVQELRESSANDMDKKQAIDKRQLNMTKKGKQNDFEGIASAAEGLENRRVSKLVPPRATGLAGLGIGKVAVSTPKGGRRK